MKADGAAALVKKLKLMQIKPQPARGTLQPSMWKDPEWVAEEKYDGDRRIAQFMYPLARFTGRTKSVKDGLFVEKTANVPHLSGYTLPNGKALAFETWTPPGSLDGTVLDGEMVCVGKVGSGGRSKYVTSIMGSLPEEAVRKQKERGWLRYAVFDCLFYKGRDLRKQHLRFRRRFAEKAVEEWGNKYAFLAEQRDTGKKDFLNEILSKGGEGVILKHVEGRYGEQLTWVKHKAKWTADVIITGFKAAKEMSEKVTGEVSMTKYAKAGLIGAVVCGQYRRRRPNEKRDFLEEVATVSGMPDKLRKDITKHPRKYLGKVLRIKHNGREPTGRFRHPRWDVIREDKAATDCVYREGET